MSSLPFGSRKVGGESVKPTDSSFCLVELYLTSHTPLRPLTSTPPFKSPPQVLSSPPSRSSPSLNRNLNRPEPLTLSHPSSVSLFYIISLRSILNHLSHLNIILNYLHTSISFRPFTCINKSKIIIKNVRSLQENHACLGISMGFQPSGSRPRHLFI